MGTMIKADSNLLFAETTDKILREIYEKRNARGSKIFDTEEADGNYDKSGW
jgi:hypothetical protein